MSKNTGTSELINYFDLGANGDVGIAGSLDVNTIANATTDTDKFLVSDTGIIKYRTGAQLLSDIGAAPAVAGGYVPYTGATTNVDLGIYNITANTIRATGSANNAGQINLRSDAIFSLVNGYGTIGSGTTNQFNFYQTTGAGVFRGAILSLNSITEFATRTFTLPDADGTIALTSSLSGYLPLTGGTLTGALIVENNAITQDGTRPIITLQQSGVTKVFLGISSGASDLVTGDASGDAVFRKPASSGAFRFSVDGGTSSAFTILSNGKVGIGTGNPDNSYQGLTISGTDPSLRLKTTSGSGWVWTEYVTSAGVNNFSMGVNQTIPYFGIKAGAGLDNPNFAIVSSGNVLIGTPTDAGFKLDVNGTGRFTQNVTIGAATAATNVKLIFNGVASKAAGIEFHQSGTPQWYIGNGIASEDNNFELYNSNGTMAMKIIKSTNTINFIGSNEVMNISGTNATSAYTGYYYNTSTLVGYIGNGTSILSGAASSDFIFRSQGALVYATNGNNERMRITSGGNVSIGTPTDTGYKLYVLGAAGMGVSSSVTANNYIANTQGLNVAGYGFLTQTISGQMTILGHNLAASTSVANQVNVVNGGWYSSMIKMYYSAGITFHTSSTVYSAGDVYPMDATERIKIKTNGEVIFHNSIILRNGQINSLTSSDSGQSMYLNFQGNGAIYAGSSYTVLYAGSDERIKTEINHSQSTLTKILNLTPRTFKYKERPEITNYGFIAQEVEKIMPELVRTSEGITMCLDEQIENQKSVESYGLAWASILVKAIQEQQQQIQELKNKLS